MSQTLSRESTSVDVSTGRRTMSSGRALTLVAISSLLFSLGGLFVRSLDHPKAWTTVFFRSGSAALSIALYLAWRTKGKVLASLRALGKPGFLVSLTFSGSSIGMMLALTQTSTSIVLVLFSLSPLLTALAARALIGEHIHPITWGAIGCTVLGVGIMVLGPGTKATVFGVILSLIAPISFALGTVVIRRNVHIAMVPAMLSASITNVIIAAPLAKPWEVSGHDLVVLLIFGFFQLGVGLAIFSSAAPYAPAAQVALVAMVEPVIGPIWSWAFKNEYPGRLAFIGGGIVFTALAVHTVLMSRKPAAS